ncbi:NTP transferase domain-containing protein [Streptomyces sp. NPDC048674]|uniref:NTP transferase domain-containing protein n=1 Tax=Streptomyces sp. NPDC048674 TaxID=3155491 RepID=UPI00324CF322
MTANERPDAPGRPGGPGLPDVSDAVAYDAVVLAGGSARRLGGADKPGVRVGGRALLDRVLAACADAAVTVVVAEPRATARPVRWAREDPPGGGPVAALDAGLRHTTAPYVVVLSADLPFLDEKTVRRLLDALAGADAATVPHAAPGAPEGGSAALAAPPSASREMRGSPGTLEEAPPALDPASADRRSTDAAGPAGSPSEGAAQGAPVTPPSPGTPPEQAASTARGASAGTVTPPSPGTPPEQAASAAQSACADMVTPPDRGARTAEGPSPSAGERHVTDARPDGVVLTDPDGRDQPLVAAYRTHALRRELAVLGAAHGGLGGLPLRRLVAALDLLRLSDPVASFDCDTWDDIAAARARIREHGHVLDEWITAVKDELGIDLDVDTGVLLDLARDAAHAVARPAAPLTTFLVGYAAARAGGGPEAVAEASRKATELALRWAAEDAPDTAPDAGKGSSPTAATGPDAG